ncbi:MAG TPA: glycosyltransferase [Candidatus Binatia bacterium]|jgi:glycosyltransferase involved in cell wall biosynthesis
MATARIVIPCFNEAQRLDPASFENFASPLHDIAFLFVNDGSTDGTLALLESLRSSNPSRFAILNLPENKGKAEAVRQGILATTKTRPAYVGFWDADLATPLDAIPSFLDLAENRPDIEIILGARVKLLGRRIERRASRHYLGRIFATAVSIILGLEVYDTQCGAKLFRVSPAMDELFSRPFYSRWIFDVEIIARLIQSRRGTNLPPAGNVIYELPLTQWRDVSGSKLRYTDFLKASWELAHVYRRYCLKSRGERSAALGRAPT